MNVEVIIDQIVQAMLPKSEKGEKHWAHPLTSNELRNRDKIGGRGVTILEKVYTWEEWQISLHTFVPDGTCNGLMGNEAIA